MNKAGPGKLTLICESHQFFDTFEISLCPYCARNTRKENYAMAVEKFESNDTAREELRKRGYRQITFLTNKDPEFWWHEQNAMAAEVARSSVFTYSRKTAAWQQVASRVKIEIEKGVLPSAISPAPIKPTWDNINLFKENINVLTKFVYGANLDWSIDFETNAKIKQNMSEMLLLIVGKLSIMKTYKENLMDEKFPNRKIFEIEITNIIICLLHIAGGLRLDLGAIFQEIMEYNRLHATESKSKSNGKKS